MVNSEAIIHNPLGKSCLECETIRFQLLEIIEALLQVANTDNDSKIKSESKSLATNELGDFGFLISIVIWFDILSVINLVSKKLQSDDMLIDVAVKEVEGLIAFFKEFRETGFDKEINVAKEIAIEMDIDLVFCQKRVIRRKRQFDENPWMKILHIPSKRHLSNLEAALKNNEQSDVDAKDLFVELRVLLTIPITVASAERSFSKLKLLKSYLRFTMSQERLNGLALIAIENRLLESVDYEDLINNFASKNARRIALFKK
ncbi:zinc finger MYM-type protein 1-like protein [Tanacetum coccineum]